MSSPAYVGRRSMRCLLKPSSFETIVSVCIDPEGIFAFANSGLRPLPQTAIAWLGGDGWPMTWFVNMPFPVTSYWAESGAISAGLGLL